MSNGVSYGKYSMSTGVCCEKLFHVNWGLLWESIPCQLVKVIHTNNCSQLLSAPMGIDYVVIGFNMEVQPLVTHNAA